MQRVSKEEFIVIATALLVLLVGLVFELVLGDCSNAFQRSGSVVVCVGIIFGYLDINSIYAESLRAEVQKLEEKRLEIDIVFGDGELYAEIPGSTNFLIRRAHSISKSGEKRVAIIDIAVLILGTLIWGFGDLIV